MAANDVPKFIPAHPPEWQDDLNPNDLAGERGAAGYEEHGSSETIVIPSD